MSNEIQYIVEQRLSGKVSVRCLRDCIYDIHTHTYIKRLYVHRFYIKIPSVLLYMAINE